MVKNVSVAGAAAMTHTHPGNSSLPFLIAGKQIQLGQCLGVRKVNSPVAIDLGGLGAIEHVVIVWSGFCASMGA